MNSASCKLLIIIMQAVNKTESASRVDQLSMQIVSLLFQECVCSGVTRYSIIIFVYKPHMFASGRVTLLINCAPILSCSLTFKEDGLGGWLGKYD